MLELSKGINLPFDMNGTDDEVNKLIDYIQTKGLPLDSYLKTAITFHKNHHYEAFTRMIHEGLEAMSRFPEAEELLLLQVSLVNCMAAHYLYLGMQEKKDPRRAMTFFNEATVQFNQADSITTEQEMTWVGKGILILSKSSILSKQDITLAEHYFNTALEKNQISIPAHLGKAFLYYESKDYINSLRMFQRLLYSWINPSLDLYVCIGICFAKLHDWIRAIKCFQVVDTLQSNTLLAISALNLQNVSHSSINIPILLKKCYQLDKSNPIILNHLANHFFINNAMDKAEALALNAYNNSTKDSIKGYSCFILAKVYQSQGNYDDAMRFYTQSTKLDPDNTCALFGLGQMYIHTNDYPSSINCFEKILQTQPNNYESLKILSALYSQNKDQKKAINCLKKLVELNPDDIEAIWEYASLIESQDHTEALSSYRAVLQKIESFSSSVQISLPVELLNNVGVLMMESKQYEDSLKYLLLAYDAAKREKKSHMNLLLSTISFNLGRIYESMNDYATASKYYKELQSTKHIPSYLRLGIIAMEQERYNEAGDLFKDAIGYDENCKEAWCLLGTQQLMTRAITPARKTFERVLSKIDKYDYYSLLSLGNIYIQIARKEIKGSKTYEQNIHRAMEFFQKCIMIDARNFYAVNGLAILCAMKEHYLGAIEAFSQIRHEEGWFSDAWINLGHVYLEENHYSAALNMYEHCLKKGLPCDQLESILLCISKTFYLMGKTQSEPSYFLKALIYLEKCLILNPADYSTRYNIALCQEGYANSSLGKTSFQRIARVIQELDIASCSFEALGEMNGSISLLKYDPKLAKQHAKHCISFKASAQEYYHKQQEEEQERQAKIDQLRQKREADVAIMKAKQEEEKSRQKQMEIEIEEQRKQVQLKAKELQEKLEGQDEKDLLLNEDDKPKKKRKLKRKESHISEDEDSDVMFS